MSTYYVTCRNGTLIKHAYAYRAQPSFGAKNPLLLRSIHDNGIVAAYGDYKSIQVNSDIQQ